MIVDDYDRARDGEPGFDKLWDNMLNGGVARRFVERRNRLYAKLPSDPRCESCHAPLSGWGGKLLKAVRGIERSRGNDRLCNACEKHFYRHPGGAETDFTMVFADIRGSTALASRIGPTEYSRLVNRFYKTAQNELFAAGGYIERVVGDEVVAIFARGMFGPDITQRAVDAGISLLRATGHGPGEPWAPLGIGIHHGRSWIGVLGSAEKTLELTSLGDVPNMTARLCAEAAPGEIVISHAALDELSAPPTVAQHRTLQPKGFDSPIEVGVIRTC